MASTILDILQPHVTSHLDALGKTATTSALHALASQSGQVLCDIRLGHSQLTPKPISLEDDPIFDLASVTKALVPATLMMQAVDERLVRLDTQVQQILPLWGNHDATVGHLLNHTSGLPAWYKYYEEVEFDLQGESLQAQRDDILARVLRTPKAPAGQVYAYSDLGYMALMCVIEALYDAPLDQLANDKIFAPLKMNETSYVNRLNPSCSPLGAVSTEWCDFRGRIVRGEVHDENTYVLGGVSGHAGVFGTAKDLLKFASHLCLIDQGKETKHTPIVSQQTLHQFWSRELALGVAKGAHHVYGWDTPSGQNSSAGRWMDREKTVGHLGFTGTSLWIDRASGVIAILLTNRVHPTRENGRIHSLRVAFHEALFHED